MKLVVISHKLCWKSSSSATGYASVGGFPFQMMALSELFDSTRLVLPYTRNNNRPGEKGLIGHNLSIIPLSNLPENIFFRRLSLPIWFISNFLTILREVLRADVVHTPIPGDIGTIGMLLAFILRKRLFVRYCGNWFEQYTRAERYWHGFMERYASDQNVMLATGGGRESPSLRNSTIGWIFSTTLTENDLESCELHWNVPTIDSSAGPRLIIVSRQDGQKGTDIVIQSLLLILTKFPNAVLDVVGDGDDLLPLKELAKSLGLSEKITFHGQVDHSHVLHLLRKAQIFCLPSKSEGFPKAVHEALACGLPVITTPVSVLPNIVGQGCGKLIVEARPDLLAQAIIELYSNPQRYQLMSQTAIQTAKQYSLEKWRDSIGERLRSSWGPLKSNA